MDDQQIIKRYFDRDEQALADTQNKYGKYCHTVAMNVLGNPEDAEECVNDTYLRAWNAIPPEKPKHLGAYLASITRNLAINRYHERHAAGRGSGETAVALDELGECLADSHDGRTLADDVTLRDALNRFLRALPEPTRGIFMRRYWFVCPIADIAREYSMGESRVKMILHRTRNRLRDHLKQEGIQV